MTKYVLRRILHGAISTIIVVALAMLLIYSLMNRQLIFQSDALYPKKLNNDKTSYMYSKWEQYGYLDYVPYSDYLIALKNDGDIDDATYAKATYPRTGNVVADEVVKYTTQFKEHYQSEGYEIVELEAVHYGSGSKIADGGNARLFAYKNNPLLKRLLSYFTGLISVDNVHYVKDDADLVGERGLTFTWHDPVYTEYNEDGTVKSEKLSPALMGNGTKYRYLFYCDNRFPYIHQNLVKFRLGMSYAVNAGYDVSETMSVPQGSYAPELITYPKGQRISSADNLHSASYVPGSLKANIAYQELFVDDYTNMSTQKAGKSKLGYSFSIGICEVILAYLLSIPLGILMALNKDKLIDKIGTAYIVFIMAVPSLAYIFMFKAMGAAAGLPTTFDMDSASKLMYVLPIVSLALPAIGGLMRWLRRYMIDQMNSDYVKFARSGGLTEGEIFSRHILKNAIIPIVHGIPGSILAAMTGAIITERVYTVPGAGNLLTTAISAYDNGVIVGLVLFYALLSIASVIMGDVLMSIVDPRISFTAKAR
ncbi:MAG: ABC transporter permease [Oscillospiraceae bacterium]|nr:ABC transporter permease [Oscillospiraceae bacterium]